jgi:agmatine deiminase
VKLLPAEWAPQSGVMLTWPHAHSDWQPFLQEVEPVFTEIAWHISRHEQVLISCWDETHQQHIRRQLDERGVDPGRVCFHIVPSNDSWARDHGPITMMQQQQPQLLDFVFNGWGNKYEAKLDNAITRQLCRQNAFGDTPIESVNLVLEGGSIESDGKGTLLTTSRCLLSPQRNPALDRPQLEQKLGELLGAERILWLEHGHLAGDDTDSHIDTLARFCAADTICHVSCDDRQDEHYTALQAMAEELAAFRQPSGEPYQLVPLPLPAPIHNEDGIRLPATYANFLIINDAVLVPVYSDQNDALALQRLGECFPQREIIAINCTPLIEQYGSLHCVTMQIPAGVSLS